MPHDDYYDADRYDTAAGWNADTSVRNSASRRLLREIKKNDPGTSPFQTANGIRTTTSALTRKPPAQLFGRLWTEGELAILLGPPSAGKSLLAVQIADQLSRRSADTLVGNGRGSRGRNSPQPDPNPFRTTAKPQKVLYIDFERTPAQFAERYSAPHPLPGKLPVRHRFPNNFTRLWLDDITDVPARFRGDLYRYLAYWIEDAIETACAPVVVIDNLSYLTRTLTHASSAGRLMKNLKLWQTRYHISLLATTPARVPNSPLCLRRGADAASAGWSARQAPARPATLANLPAAPIADLADTIFQISPSTLARDLRYIKHLKNRNAPLLSEQGWNFNSPPGLRRGADASSAGWSALGGEYDAAQVLTCQITREADQPISPNSSFINPNSAFLHLSFLGLTPESIHLTDPLALLSPPRPAVRTPQLKKGVVDMLTSREYRRYLER